MMPSISDIQKLIFRRFDFTANKIDIMIAQTQISLKKKKNNKIYQHKT